MAEVQEQVEEKFNQQRKKLAEQRRQAEDFNRRFLESNESPELAHLSTGAR